MAATKQKHIYQVKESIIILIPLVFRLIQHTTQISTHLHTDPPASGHTWTMCVCTRQVYCSSKQLVAEINCIWSALEHSLLIRIFICWAKKAKALVPPPPPLFSSVQSPGLSGRVPSIKDGEREIFTARKALWNKTGDLNTPPRSLLRRCLKALDVGISKQPHRSSVLPLFSHFNLLAIKIFDHLTLVCQDFEELNPFIFPFYLTQHGMCQLPKHKHC